MHCVCQRRIPACLLVIFDWDTTRATAMTVIGEFEQYICVNLEVAAWIAPFHVFCVDNVTDSLS